MLQIKTTGFADFIDESANIKELIIGGPGVGKTRSSSFWPKPFFLFCEPGHGAIADRGVPYVDIKSSQDMLDALAYLRRLESTPKRDREYQTIVLDTLDGFQRKVKDEWLLQTRQGTFSGYDAWGYLDSKMQMLLTRLLNADYHVLVLVHWKDKTKRDKAGEDVSEMVLQLQGDTKDTVFNDFDLVGFMDTYWAPEDGERVEKRGITFTRTPDRLMLKDRYGIMPRWLPIEFAESDYEQQRACFMQRADIEAIPDATIVGDVPTAVEDANVQAPMQGGPLPPQDPKDVPLDQYTKPDLIKMGESLGLSFKGNALKAEIIAAIKAAQEAVVEPKPEPETPSEPEPTPQPEPEPEPEPEPTPEEAEALVSAELGAEVIEVQEEPTPPPPPAAPVASNKACADCGADLESQANKDMVRLSFVKHRRYLCNSCMVIANEKKAGSK